MKRLLVFDLDGTLVDSLEDIRFALNGALRESGLPEHDSDSVRRKVGHGLGELVKAAVPSATPESARATVLAAVRRIYAEVPVRYTVAYPGMVELVSQLRAAGNAMAVLTNKAQSIASVIVEHFFPGVFHVVQGEVSGGPRKPDPKTVEKLFETLASAKGLEGYRANVATSVLIGDGDADVQTAVRAGLRSVALTWGFRSADELRRVGATNFAGNIDELRNLLSQPGFN